MPNKRNRKRIARAGVNPHKLLTRHILNKYNKRSHRAVFTRLLKALWRVLLINVVLCRISVMEVRFPFYSVLKAGNPYAHTLPGESSI